MPMPNFSKTAQALLLAMWAWIFASQLALAGVWQFTGTLDFQSAVGAPSPLSDLLGTRFVALLEYDEATLPSWTSLPQFATYLGAGTITLRTSRGDASISRADLQTFMFQGIPGRGSGFFGCGFDNIALQGDLAALTLVPTSMDLQLQRRGGYGTTYPPLGLQDLSLPTELRLSDFDGHNFLRLNFASTPEYLGGVKLIGVIDSLVAVPEPSSFAVLTTAMLCVIAINFTKRRS
jgi:hypothetical protein